MPKSEPLVCCVCLTADRQALTEHAVRCFEAQTYGNSELLVLDTGKKAFEMPSPSERGQYSRVTCVRNRHAFDGWTIGALRNFASQMVQRADIIAHWDSDDWSHPNRLTEQVAFLQSSGAEAVGYNEMLFWRAERNLLPDPRDPTKAFEVEYDGGQAWLYSRQGSKPYALGTSLCYWRKTWEHCPFKDAPKNPEATSEYQHWNVNAVRLASLSSIPKEGQPRMVARIHGGNTSAAYDLEKRIADGSREWYRVPQWDSRVREILK